MSVRVELAFDRAVDVPTEGRIAVFGPRAGDDLSPLPKDRVVVVQGFRPDYDHFAGQGYETVAQVEGRFSLSVVFVPRAKEAARAAIELAVTLTDGEVVVDGSKTDGIDSLLRDLRKRGDVGEVISKAHGKIFAVRGPDVADWAASGEREVAGGFVTRPGVFSADGPDPGSVALEAALPSRLGPRVADLGAGWGYLSRAILARDGVEELHIFEADHVALDCARMNVTDPRAVFHWADATRFASEVPFDTVVTNPPFHHGRAADPSLGRAFIQAAAALLGPRGSLWLVANRHLPYESDLTAAFRDVKEIGSNPAFKVFHATRPLKRR